MSLFEKHGQLNSLFQRSPVDAAYTQGTASGRRIAGSYKDLDVALLLLDQVKTNEFFDYQVYFVSELSKTLETQGLDVVILNQASLLQRAQVIRSWSVLYQRDVKRRVQWETRAVMDYLEFQKYDDMQTKALALPKPEQYHDILDAVAGRGLIERPLAYRLEHLANLRNLLAYDREQTDIDDVYQQIQTRLPDLRAFADQIDRSLGAGSDA